MTSPSELRLLPWSGPEDKPRYLSSDDTDSHLSRRADNTEAIQLGMATELLEQAAELLAEEKVEPNDLRLLAVDLTGALRAALGVATTRGRRLPATRSHRPRAR